MPARLRSLLLLAMSVGVLSVAAGWPGGDPKELLPVLQQPVPTFWKGNLHTHSFWSDGDDFPDMITDWYHRRGYHFLGLSDHNVLSEGERWIDVSTPKTSRALALEKYRARFGDRWVERRKKDGKEQVRLKPLAEFRGLFEQPNRFLMIPAEEITHKFAKFPVHMNAVNLRNVIQPIDGASTRETVLTNMRQVAEQRAKTGQRMLVFLNHPNFGYGVKAEDMLADEVRFFEVFNGHPGVKNYGDPTHAGTERMWDINLALRLGKLNLPIIYGVGTDDAHHYHQMAVGKSNPGRGWIMVRRSYLTPEAIVNTMEAGDFYSSSGVTLNDVRFDGKQLALSIQGEKGITYKTEYLATFRDAPLDSEPHKDKDQKPLDVTRIYSPEIGKVVASSTALESSYRLTGKELYVRTRVTSSKPHPNPFQKGDVEQAWTQPVAPR